MFSTITQIQITPDQLKELVRDAVRSELADYTPPMPVGADLPEYLTRKQTARALQVSLNTLNEWSKDTPDRKAIIIPQKVATRVRYRREDVIKALKESRRFKKAEQPEQKPALPSTRRVRPTSTAKAA
ncbi:hypothetical protein FAES_0357 [Fibrella aestuarina BUZ 2]|uniref:Helix-turn-helix domain-containing protein n=1 Tax=Fibrella aestuarina BUZ 2 TaxID=1166018 RepID=I0K2L7_9BACT|nr:helix-turn-helix domain-containing protein [Fibrella aestuarina]CCG98370.1 hypothetical protein FAES_0357 [Fibrella aestuarina BUZ 2]